MVYIDQIKVKEDILPEQIRECGEPLFFNQNGLFFLKTTTRGERWYTWFDMSWSQTIFPDLPVHQMHSLYIRYKLLTTNTYSKLSSIVRSGEGTFG